MSVYFFWKSINANSRINCILLGIFSALGFLSKYLFIYLIASFFIYFIFNFRKFKKLIPNCLLSLLIFFTLLIPHLIWLFENNFITIFYGLDRSDLSDFHIAKHFINPIVFLFKQILILIPFFIMFSTILKKIKFKFNINNKIIFFLISINLIPFLLVLLTSIITGAQIRTMWMTPFYLFFGVLIVYIFQAQINLKKLNGFISVFLVLFIFSPFAYAYISITKTDKRTDYPGKEVSIKTQYAWDQNHNEPINIVLGDEWYAGNLSYHLKSRPVWEGPITKLKLNSLSKFTCIDNICVGNK